MEAGGSGEVMQFDVANKEQVKQVLEWLDGKKYR